MTVSFTDPASGGFGPPLRDHILERNPDQDRGKELSGAERPGKKAFSRSLLFPRRALSSGRDDETQTRDGCCQNKRPNPLAAKN
jgi:hypothetical protein